MTRGRAFHYCCVAEMDRNWGALPAFMPLNLRGALDERFAGGVARGWQTGAVCKTATAVEQPVRFRTAIAVRELTAVSVRCLAAVQKRPQFPECGLVDEELSAYYFSSRRLTVS